MGSLRQKLNCFASKQRKIIFSPSGTWGGLCIVQERKSEEESAEEDRGSSKQSGKGRVSDTLPVRQYLSGDAGFDSDA